MSLLQRYILFIFGLFLTSLGLCLIIKGGLGTSPISSLPYILNLKYHMSLGTLMFILNIILMSIQLLILKRNFTYIQILQIPMSFIFSAFIDLIMFTLNSYVPEIYMLKLLTLLLGCGALGLGVALQIIGNVVMLPGEATVNAIATHWKFDFGKVKTCFDISMVLLCGILSLFYFSSIKGLREGTIISALLVGFIARFCIKQLSNVNRQGILAFQTNLHAQCYTSHNYLHLKSAILIVTFSALGF